MMQVSYLANSGSRFWHPYRLIYMLLLQAARPRPRGHQIGRGGIARRIGEAMLHEPLDTAIDTELECS